ncbi:MAG: SIS domain-containing protein [Ruminococcaceae bacterium]|nr:SIS domain-containing protein [Oscillospiraceae bacterium]MBQ4047957.1 SIS domain-containing protein [Clostridia bacterium]
MSAIDLYFNEVSRILDTVRTTQRDAIEQAAQAFCDAIAQKRNIFAFGCSHGGMMAMELFYRAGGLIPINYIRAPGMMLELTPITMTSEMERMEGFGDMILKNTPAKSGDVLFIHSVTGRNAVPIDMARTAREMGMTVIVMTNLNSSKSQPSRHSSGTKLYDHADILLDNCGCIGDSSLKLEGLAEKTAPTSTIAGAAICNSIVARSIELMIEAGIEPPVFLSANVEGGDEHNARMLEKYKDNVFYM